MQFCRLSAINSVGGVLRRMSLYYKLLNLKTTSFEVSFKNSKDYRQKMKKTILMCLLFLSLNIFVGKLHFMQAFKA